jgi:hypothetical protein
MIYPLEEVKLIEIYHCPVCSKPYRRNHGHGPRLTCAVSHAPGDCCHFGDHELTPVQLGLAFAVLTNLEGLRGVEILRISPNELGGYTAQWGAA